MMAKPMVVGPHPDCYMLGAAWLLLGIAIKPRSKDTYKYQGTEK